MDIKRIGIWIAIVLAFVILVGGGMFFLSRSGNVAVVEANQGARVGTSDNEVRDWGRIDMNQGDVITEFSIKSSGEKDLQLFNISTSCACTKAHLESGEAFSPYFGMHSVSDYVMTVRPGEVAKLVVDFDPAFHGPSGVGEIERTITVQTNDPDHRELTFKAKGTVYR